MAMNRRKFIKYAGCGAMTSTTMLSSLINLRAMSSAAIATGAGTSDYKALVCLSLQGGNDSYNMLIPTTPDEFSTYREVRSNVALERSALQDLSGTVDGRTFALHPNLPNLRRFYDEQRLAFIANVGTLIEPITVNDFFTRAKRLPLGLLSHSDQLQQWQTAIPHERSAQGWGTRMTELINDMNPGLNTNQLIPMNISLDGNNIFQSGQNSSPFSINPFRGAIGIQGFDESPILASAVRDMLSQNYADVYKDTYLGTLNQSLEINEAYSTAIENVNLGVTFPNTNIGASFEQVAKTIAVHETLGFRRQTFYIRQGGYDTHDNFSVRHDLNMQDLDLALASFQLAMDQLGCDEQVLSFVISDFARTLRSNGSGTDHAWGGNVFALGGPVRGGQVYGDYPVTLDFRDNTVDLGGGVLVPTTSADVYFAEIAQWFGVSQSNLGDIFPNLINFYDFRNDSNNSPLGFLTLS